ncbi:MAG TPA: hypothetical protein VGD73_31155 [Pseudonocardia sp.]|jgi:hypothetical protein|uniref:hypothetical protein n=1 Tax=Pseudonocardia sp. TaxID=60912 RepID=UPI002ED888C5
MRAVPAPDRWQLAILGYALLAALCRPLTWPAAAAVLAPGLVLLAIRVRRPVRALPKSARPAHAVGLWVALLAVFGSWELVAGLWGNNAEHPTVSLLLDPALESYPVRALAYAAWLLAGRWLVAR